MFLVEEPDPMYGYIKAQHVLYKSTNEKVKQEIEMIPCADLVDLPYESDDAAQLKKREKIMKEIHRLLSIKSQRGSSAVPQIKYLCPNIQNLTVQGKFESEEDFQYIKVSMAGCQLKNQ